MFFLPTMFTRRDYPLFKCSWTFIIYVCATYWATHACSLEGSLSTQMLIHFHYLRTCHTLSNSCMFTRRKTIYSSAHRHLHMYHTLSNSCMFTRRESIHSSSHRHLHMCHTLNNSCMFTRRETIHSSAHSMCHTLSNSCKFTRRKTPCNLRCYDTVLPTFTFYVWSPLGAHA